MAGGEKGAGWRRRTANGTHLRPRLAVLGADGADQATVDERVAVGAIALAAKGQVAEQSDVVGPHPGLAVRATCHPDVVLDLVGRDRYGRDLHDLMTKWRGNGK